jgi:hypothetical protein
LDKELVDKENKAEYEDRYTRTGSLRYRIREQEYLDRGEITRGTRYKQSQGLRKRWRCNNRKQTSLSKSDGTAVTVPATRITNVRPKGMKRTAEAPGSSIEKEKKRECANLLEKEGNEVGAQQNATAVHEDADSTPERVGEQGPILADGEGMWAMNTMPHSEEGKVNMIPKKSPAR